MAELVDQWSAEGKKNIFGQPVKVVEMQSEAVLPAWSMALKNRRAYHDLYGFTRVTFDDS